MANVHTNRQQALGRTELEGRTGRIEDVMRKHADQLGFDHSNSVAYACGHPQMVANVKAILARARFRKDQIKEEKYFSLDAIDLSSAQ